MEGWGVPGEELAADPDLGELMRMRRPILSNLGCMAASEDHARLRPDEGLCCCWEGAGESDFGNSAWMMGRLALTMAAAASGS